MQILLDACNNVVFFSTHCNVTMMFRCTLHCNVTMMFCCILHCNVTIWFRCNIKKANILMLPQFYNNNIAKFAILQCFKNENILQCLATFLCCMSSDHLTYFRTLLYHLSPAFFHFQSFLSIDHWCIRDKVSFRQ